MRENDYIYLSTDADRCSIPTNITANLTYKREYNALSEDELNQLIVKANADHTVGDIGEAEETMQSLNYLEFLKEWRADPLK